MTGIKDRSGRNNYAFKKMWSYVMMHVLARRHWRRGIHVLSPSVKQLRKNTYQVLIVSLVLWESWRMTLAKKRRTAFHKTKTPPFFCHTPSYSLQYLISTWSLAPQKTAKQIIKMNNRGGVTKRWGGHRKRRKVRIAKMIIQEDVIFSLYYCWVID